MVSSSAYIATGNGTTLFVVSISTNTISATISGFSDMQNIAISPNGNDVYVANAISAGKVSIVDTSTNVVSSEISGLSYPYALAITPNGDYAYIINNGTNTVSVISIPANTLSTTISGFDNIQNIGINSNGNYVYVPNINGNTISVVDTSTNTISATISGFDFPNSLVSTPNGDYVYVTNYDGDSVSAINTSTNIISTTISGFSSPNSVAITPNGDYAYVVNSVISGTISVIDISTNTITTTFNDGDDPIAIAITSNGNYAYSSQFTDKEIEVFNTSTNASITTIGGLISPTYIVFTPKISTSTTTFYGTSSAAILIVPNVVKFSGDIYNKSSFALNELYTFEGKFPVENSFTVGEKNYFMWMLSAENSLHLNTVYISLLETMLSSGVKFSESSVLFGAFEESALVTLNSLFETSGQVVLSASAGITVESLIEKVNLSVLEKVKLILAEASHSSLDITAIKEELKFVANEYTLIKLLEESEFKFAEVMNYVAFLQYKVLESINLESYISSGKLDLLNTETVSFLGTTKVEVIFTELATSGFSITAYTEGAKSYVLTSSFPPFISSTVFVSTWTNVVDMVGQVLRGLGFPVVYYSDVKTIQVDTQNLLGAYVMEGAEPTLYWHNWANMYRFKLRLYEMGLPSSFTKYDDAIQQKMMYRVIGNRLADGGVVIGYNAVSNIKPMVRERGITLIEYTLKILVLY